MNEGHPLLATLELVKVQFQLLQEENFGSIYLIRSKHEDEVIRNKVTSFVAEDGEVRQIN